MPLLTCRWCAPYAYKQRSALGCGGADKWSVVPERAFPHDGWGWSGSLYCEGGHFCTNSTSVQARLSAAHRNLLMRMTIVESSSSISCCPSIHVAVVPGHSQAATAQAGSWFLAYQ